MAADKKNKLYDPSGNREYQAYLTQLETARQNKPTYQGTYETQAGALYDRLQNREAFSYDINTDALYQMYRDQYQRQGQLAMEDTLGRAQSMTGGYGNSYAQTASQQTYQNYMTRLNDAALSLYDRALERYRREGSDLREQYDLTRDMEQQEYARHKDALDAYRKDLSFIQGQADQAYERGYRDYLQSYQLAEDAYDRLIYLMDKKGYKPTREELLEAGFTEAQASALGR